MMEASMKTLTSLVAGTTSTCKRQQCHCFCLRCASSHRVGLYNLITSRPRNYRPPHFFCCLLFALYLSKLFIKPILHFSTPSCCAGPCVNMTIFFSQAFIDTLCVTCKRPNMFFVSFFLLLLYNITSGDGKVTHPLTTGRFLGRLCTCFISRFFFSHQLSNCSNITFLNKMVQCDGGRMAAQRQKQYD